MISEKEIHNKIIDSLHGEISVYAVDIANPAPFHCLMWNEKSQKVESRYCETPQNAKHGVYVNVNRKTIRELAREEIDVPLETVERFTIIATVADWIDSGQAARDLLVKIEEEKSDLTQTPEIPNKNKMAPKI